MRCRRLCERKPSGRLQVEASMSDAYKAGGEQREALEMTLLESLATHGHGRSSYKKIKARTIHTSMCSPSLIGVYIVWMYTVYMCMHACYSCMLTNACTHQDNWVHIWFSILLLSNPGSFHCPRKSSPPLRLYCSTRLTLSSDFAWSKNALSPEKARCTGSG